MLPRRPTYCLYVVTVVDKLIQLVADKNVDFYCGNGVCGQLYLSAKASISRLLLHVYPTTSYVFSNPSRSFGGSIISVLSCVCLINRLLIKAGNTH
jgi:hypothetical protein